MSSESPASELYSSDGYELSAINNVTTPTGTRGIIAVGSDGTSSRFIKTDSSGNQIVVGLGVSGTPAGGIVSVQGVSGMTALTVNNATAANLLANVGGLAATGAAASGNPVYVAGLSTTSAPTYGNSQVNPLSLTAGGALRVDGSAVTQPVSGTVTATNPSVGTTAASPPASATYMGGSVTTNAPGYTTGQMDPLSLTTAGLLRIDGVYPINTTTTTTDATFVAAAVTATAPGYTTGQMSALSLNTTGDLRAISKVSDGTNTAAVKAASTAAVATDPALVTSFSPNSSLPTGSNTIGVVNQGTAASLANAWSQKLTDGTNGPVAVKAASTAAVAADPALVVTLSPNSAHIKGTIEPLYGTNNQAMTITLASQASAAARASTAVDNTTNLYEDVLLFFKYMTGASGVSGTGYVNVYGYGTVDGGTTYPEGITGTDATVTLTSPPNLVLIAQFNANTNGATKTFGPVSFCRMYGMDRLPAKWGVVVVNQTGVAAGATAGNFAVTYQGINGQLV